MDRLNGESMLFLRITRWNRWFITVYALFVVTTALTGGFYSPPGELLWHRVLFPLGISLFAAANWAAPLELWTSMPGARKRLFWALLAASMLVMLVRIYLFTCARDTCFAI